MPVAPSWLGHRPEDIPPKSESVRKVNPPERLAAWDARWPRGAER